MADRDSNLTEILRRMSEARDAARSLHASPASKRNGVLTRLGELLVAEEKSVLAANQEDLSALPGDAAAAFRDRLTLNRARLEGMRESLHQVAALPDPIGEIVEEKTLKNGLLARRVRSPLGVLFMIFESRPNVAIEAFSLALKSGNVIALRGGKESQRTVGVFYDLIRRALGENGLPEAALVGITNSDRAIVNALLTRPDLIDVVVPRGGDGLIRFVTENSKIPVIKNDRGMCHIYVHEDADLTKALPIVRNAKVQRPGVCNAMETLLVHRSVAAKFLPEVAHALPEVEFHAGPRALAVLQVAPGIRSGQAGAGGLLPATENDFDTEYLDLKLNVKVVDSLEDAISHIAKHGSKHSESILTASRGTFETFRDGVDSAAVYWNASTRFTDGFELGLGGELGISTQKLHVRGPVGLRELTSVRWVIEGTGQIR